MPPDELSSLEDLPAPDPPAPKPSRYSFWVRTQPTHLRDYYCFSALSILHELTFFYEASSSIVAEN